MDPILAGVCVVMSVLGAGLGLFSGLAPGIHVNTLAAMLLASYPSISSVIPGIWTRRGPHSRCVSA